MARSQNIETTLAFIRASLAEKLGDWGYQIVYTKDDDQLYGSYFVIWSDDKEMIKLSWNGLEKVFRLDLSTDLPYSSESGWQNISVTAFEPTNGELDYQLAAAEKVVRSLSS